MAYDDDDLAFSPIEMEIYLERKKIRPEHMHWFYIRRSRWLYLKENTDQKILEYCDYGIYYDMYHNHSITNLFAKV